MKKKIVTISIITIILASIGVVLANNKAKIDKAAKPVKDKVVVPVKVIEVKEDSFNTAFTLNGSTSPVKEVKLASEVQGKLIGLYINNGDHVSAGQVIAVLDAGVSGAQLNSIDASMAKTRLDIQRYEKLVEMGGATVMQVENVKLQYASLMADRKQVLEQMAHMQIRAPFSGKIENVKVERGSYVSYGTILADLIDNSSLKINVYLSEQEAFKVKPGQPVQINSVVLTKAKEGKVSMISDKADASGKFLTEITFSNKDKETMKAGMLTDVLFPVQKIETGLSVPASALLGGAANAKVFVVKNGQVQQRSIKIGVVTATKVQVTEGLQAGEQVVISGQLNLENGSPVSINK